HALQDLLPVCGLSEKAGKGDCAHHSAEDNKEVPLPLFGGTARHELQPSSCALFHQIGDTFSDGELRASDLRSQRRNGATTLQVLTVLKREITADQFLPPLCFRHL